MMKVVAVSMAAAALLTVVSAAQAQTLQPSQSIRLKEHAYGCLSKEKFDAAYQHEQAGEKAQMQELFNGYQCISVPTDDHYRVIRVVDHDVEFAGSHNNDNEGLWTTDRFILQ